MEQSTAETVTLNVYVCLQGRGGVEKLVLRYYVLNGWPQTNVVEYFLFIGTAKYTKASPPARKMLLFSSIIITIILSYTIIKIYIILHIYVQASETEGLAELHWVIGQSLLEKINSIYFRGISLVFSRMSNFQYRSLISNLITWNLSKSIFYIRISTKEQAFTFSKRNSYTNACFKFLCDALITSLLIF